MRFILFCVEIIIIGVIKYIIVNDSMYVLYVTSFGINNSDKPVKQILGISVIGSLPEDNPLNTIILIKVIIKIHIKNTNTFSIVAVNIENTIILTQIIIGE
jgi:hypothetical protein